nr:hypothetical protein [Tanacetum cinerariifolium]
MDLLTNLLETCNTLTRRVENLEQNKIAQALEITKLKQMVRKLENKKKLRVSRFIRLRKVGTTQRIESFADTVMDDQEDASKKREIIANIDADENVTLKDVAAVVKFEKDADVQGRPEESQAQFYKIDLEYADKVLSMQNDIEEPAELQEVIEVVTTAKLMIKVVTAATTIITVAAPVTAATIIAVPTGAKRRKVNDIEEPAELQEVIEVVTTAKLMIEVVTAATTIITVAAPVTAATIIAVPTEETATPLTIVHSEPKSKDKGKGNLVEEPKPLKKQAQIEQDEAYAREYQTLKRKPQTEAQAKKNMIVYLKNMAGFKMDYFKGMSYDDIRPIFEKYFNSNVAFLEECKEQLEEEENRALKRQRENLEEKVAKKQKLDEETYCCWYKMMLLDDAADIKLRLMEQSAAVDEKIMKYD